MDYIFKKPCCPLIFLMIIKSYENMTGRTNFILENQAGPMPKQVDQSFATAMRLMRKQPKYKKYTQSKIAQKLNISQGYVAKIYGGKKKGSEEVRRKIAALFDFDGSEPGRTYDDFIKVGHSALMVENSKKPDRKPLHKNTKLSWQEEKNGKGESVPDKPSTFGYMLSSNLDNENQESGPDNETEAKIRAIHQEYKNLIEAFLDQATAYDLNKKLLEIERYDPEIFQHIKDYVDLIYSKLNLKKNAGNDSE